MSGLCASLAQSKVLGAGVLPEPFDERDDLGRAAMWCIRKAIDIHPGGSRRYTWIARVEVLVEVRHSKTDYGQMNALNTLGAERRSYRA
jgi:hypothetical protein